MLFTTQSDSFKVCSFVARFRKTEAYHPLPIDSLKCIAWKGRAVVVGFAGGKIEKVPVSHEQSGLVLIIS